MVTTVKWSDFDAGSAVSGANISVGLQSGDNVQWTMSQLATFFWASPTLVTPTLGVATATSISAPSHLVTGSSSGTVTIQGAAAAGTWSFTLPTSGGTNGYILTTNGSGVASWTNPTALGVDLDVGTTAITNGTTTRILYDNGGVLGEYTLTGSGTVVAMQTAPTFATSITTPSVLATANDSGALGASGTAFADLFLASGGIINWNAGNVTLAHAAGKLTLIGSLVSGTDNTYDLGSAPSSRWRTGYFGTALVAPVLTVTQGTITSDSPQINGSVTWNDSGIAGPAWKLNATDTSSNAAALLVDLQVASSSKFKVDKTGLVTTTNLSVTKFDGTYLLSNPTSDPDHGGYAWRQNYSSNIIDIYLNDVWNLGINIDSGGGRVDATKVMLGLAFESKFFQGGQYQSEIHFDFIDLDGQHYRPLQIDLPHDPDLMDPPGQWLLQGGRFTYKDWEDEVYFTLDKTDAGVQFTADELLMSGTLKLGATMDADQYNITWTGANNRGLVWGSGQSLKDSDPFGGEDPTFRITTTGGGVYARSTNNGSAGAFFATDHATASPEPGDIVGGLVIYGRNSAAAVYLMGGVDAVVTDATASAVTSYLGFRTAAAGSDAGAYRMRLTSTALSPETDGAGSLGTTARGWQNLFGNTGFVLNIENSDWVATHTTGILTVGTGDLRVTNNFTNATSVVTVGGAQTLANKTLTTPVIGAATGTSLVATGILTARSATATPAAASAVAGLTMGSAGVALIWGTGDPNASVTAAQGSLYIRTDGTNASNRLYSNTSGSTVWISVSPETNGVYYAADYGFATANSAAVNKTALDACVTAASAGGIVFIGAGTFNCNPLATVSANGIHIMGSGQYGGTFLRTGSTSADFVTFTGQHQMLSGLCISGAAVKATGGYAIKLDGVFHAKVHQVRIEYMFGGIFIEDGSSPDIDWVVLRYLLGPNGIYVAGTNGNGVFGWRINRLDTDNPYPNGTIVVEGAWGAATGYTAGDVVTNNGYIWQCASNGTSAGAGGPSTIPGTTGENAFTTAVTDNTTSWYYVANASLAWLIQDNYAYSGSCDNSALLNGGYGFRSIDTAASSSAPTWFNSYGLEIDHPYTACISIERGNGAYFTQGWFGSCLAGNGVSIGANCGGEVVLGPANRIVGNAQNGILVQSGPVGVIIEGNQIGLNSQASSGTYHGINIAANAGNLIIANNTSGRIATGTGQQGYGILINTGTGNYITCRDNITEGNATGGVSNGATGVANAIETGLGGGLAYTTYVPTYTAVSGSITTMTTNRAVFTKDGTQVTAHIDVTVTNAGTGAGALKVTLPWAAASANFCGFIGGREMASTGKGISGVVHTTNGMYVQLSDAANPIVTGYQLAFTAIYEAA